MFVAAYVNLKQTVDMKYTIIRNHLIIYCARATASNLLCFITRFFVSKYDPPFPTTGQLPTAHIKFGIFGIS